jgi:Patatin-like phospholipase
VRAAVYTVLSLTLPAGGSVAGVVTGAAAPIARGEPLLPAYSAAGRRCRRPLRAANDSYPPYRQRTGPDERDRSKLEGKLMKAAMSGARGPDCWASPKTAESNIRSGHVDLLDRRGRWATSAPHGGRLGARAGACRPLSAPCRHAIPAALLFLTLVVVGCTGTARAPSEAANASDQASVLGIPNARFFADTQAAAMVQEALRALERERAARPASAGASLPPANFLAISGGADDGAFGAGLLNGWTEAGTRPEFKLVSGVSTGSLIAPFAFLGPAYDPQLRAVYTNVQPADIYEERSIVTAVFKDALADTTPLFHLISRYVNEDMLAAIAREYGKGRLLLIGTTNLDVQRPVLWNIGAIAASGRPGAIDLVRKILLASAAAPGMFPPVMIDVEVGGKSFQEMHVDGGAIAQMFLYPPSVKLAAMGQHAAARERHAFLIRNSRLDPEWASVDRRLLSIAGRAISTMIHYSGYNDALRIYATTQRDGVGYNLAYIGADFNAAHKEPFDQAYMRALFDYGYQRARRGYSWSKTPPILETAGKP